MGREHLGSLGDRLGWFGQIREVHRSQRLAYPVASRHSRNGPANIIQRLKELGRNGMRTIFIAHDRHDRNFRVAGHPSLIVRFAEKSVHPFQHALCYTRRLRSEEHTSELQSLMRISYAVFCLKKKHKHYKTTNN